MKKIYIIIGIIIAVVILFVRWPMSVSGSDVYKYFSFNSNYYYNGGNLMSKTNVKVKDKYDGKLTVDYCEVSVSLKVRFSNMKPPLPLVGIGSTLFKDYPINYNVEMYDENVTGSKTIPAYNNYINMWDLGYHYSTQECTVNMSLIDRLLTME